MHAPRSRLASACAALLLAALPLAALAQTADNQKCRDPVANCDASVNYFPESERISIEYATQTIPELTFSNTYVDMTVNFTVFGAAKPEQRKYRLVKCGCRPDAEEGRTTVYLNPNGVYLDDSVSIAMIDALDPELTALKYIMSDDYKYNKDLRDKVSSGVIKEATGEDLKNDKELSAIIENPFGLGGDAVVNGSSEATPAVIIAELDEQSPLARAEWMKFFGLYLNKVSTANILFNAIVKDYDDIVAKAKSATRRPSVFFNAPSKSFTATESTPFAEKYTWSQPGGNTYIAQYMLDANADFRMHNDGKEGSDSMTLDEIKGNFKSAHFLLNADYIPNAAGRTMRDFVTLGAEGDLVDKELESYLKEFTAVRCGNVISRSLRVAETGPGTSGNDAFEKAVVRPDLMLADFVKLLHPNVNIGSHNLAFMYEYGVVDSLGLSCPFASLLGEPQQGSVYVDKTLTISGLSRYAVQDALESKVFPQLEERGVSVNRTDFQFPDAGSADETTTSVVVRREVAEDEEEEAKESEDVLLAFRQGLGDDVEVEEAKQAEEEEEEEPETDSGSEENPEPESGSNENAEADKDDDSGGLGAAAIIGIVTGCLFGTLLLILAFLWFRARSKIPPTQYADMEVAGEHPVTS